MCLERTKRGGEGGDETRGRWCRVVWATEGAPAFTLSEMEQGRDWT